MMLKLGGRAVLDKYSQEAQFECRSSLLWEFYGKPELILESSMVALESSRSRFESWLCWLFAVWPFLPNSVRIPSFHCLNFTRFFFNKEKVLIVFIFT